MEYFWYEDTINTCLNYYELDPCHYFSSPGLSWDAMLKMTGIELELISDINMHLFIEKGMRGGISYIANSNSKADNKYVKNYDSTKEKIFMVYFDPNNLYGWAMTQYLPYGNFRWMTRGEINKLDLGLIRENSTNGYILEVDLEYPSELHDFHNDYPLTPEKLRFNSNMLPKYSSTIANNYGIKVGESNKLIPNLVNKKNYVIHYRNLQLYLSLGMKVTKVHRILKFKQSDWLTKFVDFNTKKRKNAINNFEKNFFKLMINSVFGKTMENLREMINVRLINNVKCVSKPTFVSKTMFSKNLVAIHKIKSVLVLNKPIYVGFSILELSKLSVYDFHYEYFKNKFNSRRLFTDTDSLVYEIKVVDDIYEKIYSDKDLFDFSDYPKNSKF